MYFLFFVIPAKAGIQKYKRFLSRYLWIPAFAGMTKRSLDEKESEQVKQVIKAIEKLESENDLEE